LALLLGHAAFLSAKKKARRRAALWYLSAANRLEKIGIVSWLRFWSYGGSRKVRYFQKPLTMYFLRRAHELYKQRPPKELSPSFWESEGDEKPQEVDAVVSGIEHPLGKDAMIPSYCNEAIPFYRQIAVHNWRSKRSRRYISQSSP